MYLRREDPALYAHFLTLHSYEPDEAPLKTALYVRPDGVFDSKAWWKFVDKVRDEFTKIKES